MGRAAGRAPLQAPHVDQPAAAQPLGQELQRALALAGPLLLALLPVVVEDQRLGQQAGQLLLLVLALCVAQTLGQQVGKQGVLVAAQELQPPAPA